MPPTRDEVCVFKSFPGGGRGKRTKKNGNRVVRLACARLRVRLPAAAFLTVGVSCAVYDDGTFRMFFFLSRDPHERRRRRVKASEEYTEKHYRTIVVLQYCDVRMAPAHDELCNNNNNVSAAGRPQQR